MTTPDTALSAPFVIAQADAPGTVLAPAPATDATAAPVAAPPPSVELPAQASPADAGPAEGAVLVEPAAPSGFDLGHAIDMLELGGPVVAILLVLSVAGLAIILRKLFQLLPLGRRRRAAVLAAVAIWREGRRPEGLAALKRTSGPTASVVSAAMVLSLQRMKPAIVREEVERIAGEELALLRRHLRGLESIAQVSPLLGLFGTILGMIEAFKVLQSAGSQVDPGMLAGGIWVALLTTAVGLAVAIPCNLALHWMDGRIDAERQSIESLATAVLTSAEAQPFAAEREAAERETTEPIGAVPFPLARAAHAH